MFSQISVHVTIFTLLIPKLIKNSLKSNVYSWGYLETDEPRTDQQTNKQGRLNQLFLRKHPGSKMPELYSFLLYVTHQKLLDERHTLKAETFAGRYFRESPKLRIFANLNFAHFILYRKLMEKTFALF